VSATSAPRRRLIRGVLQLMNKAITGFWQIKSPIDENEHDIGFVGGDGRIVNSIVCTANPVRRSTVRLWAKQFPDDPNNYEIRLNPQGNSWICRMVPEGDILISHQDGAPASVLNRLAQGDVPLWFHDVLRQSLERMIQIETEQNKAVHGNA
jgi:hypothetical protein